ncbi:MAG: hypothetical protein CHACPFDD_00857 [Phycisphaerae bacterium]|nr:hypothetical protein [Phycisphaerae bacterium]
MSSLPLWAVTVLIMIASACALVFAAVCVLAIIILHSAARTCQSSTLSAEERADNEKCLARLKLLKDAVRCLWLGREQLRPLRGELADLALDLGDWDAAILALRPLVREAPHDLLRVNQIALVFLRLGRWADIIRVTNLAIPPPPGSDSAQEAYVRGYRAWAFAEVNESRQALHDARWLWENAPADSWAKWEHLWLLQQDDRATKRTDYLPDIVHGFAYLSRARQHWWIRNLTWSSLCCDIREVEQFADIALALFSRHADLLVGGRTNRDRGDAATNGLRVHLALIAARSFFLRGDGVAAQCGFEYAMELSGWLPPAGTQGDLKSGFGQESPLAHVNVTGRPEHSVDLPAGWPGAPLDYSTATACASDAERHLWATTRYLSPHSYARYFSSQFLQGIGCRGCELLSLGAEIRRLAAGGLSKHLELVPKLIRSSKDSEHESRNDYRNRLTAVGLSLLYEGAEPVLEALAHRALAMVDVLQRGDVIERETYSRAIAAGESVLASQTELAREFYSVALSDTSQLADIRQRAQTMRWLGEHMSAAGLEELGRSVSTEAEDWNRIAPIAEFARSHNLDVGDALFSARRLANRDAEDHVLHNLMDVVVRSIDLENRTFELVELAIACDALGRYEWAERAIFAARNQAMQLGRTLEAAQLFCRMARSISPNLTQLRKTMIGESAQFAFSLASGGGLDSISRDRALRLWEQTKDLA